jgi:hypothetical protein
MGRNAADAARSARPKGEHFSVSIRIFHEEVVVTNGTGWKGRTRELNPTVSFINISILNQKRERIPRRLRRGQRANHKKDRIPYGRRSLQLAAGIFKNSYEMYGLEDVSEVKRILGHVSLTLGLTPDIKGCVPG